MAEIGVIASGMGVASLAIQVADSILKLKDFLDSVKEAPEEIKYLIEEIDTLSALLSEFDADISNEESKLDSSSMRKCWEHCSRGLGLLEAIVRELDADIGKQRRIGSFKAVLKKGTIERLKDRLKSAQIMLLMAHQIYATALQKQNSIFHRKLAEAQQEKLLELITGVFQTTKIMVSIQETITSSQPTSRISDVDGEHDKQNEASTGVSLCPIESSVQTYRRIGQASKKRRFEFRLQAPPWLKITNHAIEVRAQQAPFGWKFTFEMYNMVELDAPIMKYSQAGNVTAIQDLFAKQEASPNDRTWWGETALGRAVSFGQLEVCRLLTQQGADGYGQISDRFGSIPAVIRVIGGMYLSKGAQHQLDLARLLTNRIDLGEHLPQNFRGGSMLLSWLRSVTISGYEQLDLRSRVCFTIGKCYVANQPYLESLVRGLLGSYATESTACGVSDEKGRTLLHCALWHLGEQYHTSSKEYNSLASDKSKSKYFCPRQESNVSVLKSLLGFVSELVVARSDLHRRAVRWLPNNYETPLLAIIYGFTHANNIYFEERSEGCSSCSSGRISNRLAPETKPEKALVAVLLWLRVLESAGIDLEEYGHEEKLLYQKGLARNICSFRVAGRLKWNLGTAMPTWKIYSVIFKYGPTPSDWKFWLIEQMDDSFWEFWDMVDHPERAMPGYWDERFDEMED